MSDPFELPITTTTAEIAHNAVFAPWVKNLGPRDMEVSDGYATAVLPQNPDLQFFSGLCVVKQSWRRSTRLHLSQC